MHCTYIYTYRFIEVLNIINTYPAIKAYFSKNDHTNDDWICVDYVKYFYESVGIDIGTVHTPSDVVTNVIRNLNKSLHYVENKVKR
jgi:hypothetical protein